MLAVIAAIALQLTLPRRLSLPPRELLPALELLVLLGLTVANPLRMVREHRLTRLGGLALVGLLSVANGVSAALLVDRLVSGHVHGSARSLLVAGTNVYLTNVIAFSLWYWEYDRGGPAERRRGTQPHPDLMFPQMASPDLAPKDWEPLYVDYLYVSFTNATAFSPTDTMPMSRTAKLLMGLQSAVALVTVALVVARARQRPAVSGSRPARPTLRSPGQQWWARRVDVGAAREAHVVFLHRPAGVAVESGLEPSRMCPQGPRVVRAR